MNNNTGIYIRVSTDEQAKYGFSIAAQKEKLVSYASIKDWNIYQIYVDEGVSGKNLNRPKIKEMIEDIKKQKINNILVYKIDRLTRSTKDLIDLIDLFSKHKCEFNSLTESIDTSTPSGRMFVKIIGLFAEFERETIAERIKIGFERKAKEGYSLCSSISSYGYMRKKGEKIQMINVEEAKVVKDIFDLYIKYKNINKIKEYLINHDISTKKNKTWNNKTIKNILSNPNYIGKVRYGINTKDYFEVKGKHKNIISIDKYNYVQNLLKNELRTKDDAYYSNKLKCICGKNMNTKRTYINNKVYINYRCSNINCSFKCISHYYLDKYFGIEILSQKTKKSIVQNTIKEIAILSLKKDIKTLYKCVKLKNKKFTLVKK